jgi:hypothetical protein
MATPQPQRSDHSPGDEELAERLAELAGERLVLLNDRGSIDHLAVTPRGVFVIDAKLHDGAVERRRFGSILRSDVRLYVGGCDRTKLLEGVDDRVDLVRGALTAAGFSDAPVRGVLCFIGAEWGRSASPFKLGDVLVTYPRFLYRVLSKEAGVATSTIQDAACALAIAFPSA